MSIIREIQLLSKAYFRIPFQQFTEYLMRDVSSNEKQRDKKYDQNFYGDKRWAGPGQIVRRAEAWDTGHCDTGLTDSAPPGPRWGVTLQAKGGRNQFVK